MNNEKEVEAFASAASRPSSREEEPSKAMGECPKCGHDIDRHVGCCRYVGDCGGEECGCRYVAPSAPTLEGAEQWSNESMRLLDLYVRGFKPIDVARDLVEKYRVNHPDVFDSNPAHADEQLLASAEGKLPERPKRESYPAHGSGFIVFYPQRETDSYADVIEAQLLAAHKEIARLTVLWTDANRWWNEEMARRVKAEVALAQQTHHYAEKAIGDIVQAFKSESIEATVVRGSLSGTIAATLRMLGWPCSSERGYMTADEFRHVVTHYNELRLAFAQRDALVLRLRAKIARMKEGN